MPSQPVPQPRTHPVPASPDVLGARLSPQLRRIVLALLLLAACPSLLVGVRRALTDSRDLQWGGAWLLRHNIDPWAEALHGYPNHLTFFSPPNYLHHLYVLLLPLSLLRVSTAAALWCSLNLALSIGCVFLLRRLLALPLQHTIALLCLLWMSSPFRVTMASGQMSLVELFCLIAAFSAFSEPVRGVSFGLSLAKYSFSPPTALFFLVRRRVTLLAIAVAMALAGLLIAHTLVRTPLLQLATEPLALAGRAVWPGVADVMTLVETLLTRTLPKSTAQHIAYAVSLLASLAFALLLRPRRLSRGTELALLSVVSLFLFKHLIYDYVFLLPALALAISAEGRRLRYPTLALIALFWYAASFLNRSTNLDTGAVVLWRLWINVFLLAALLLWLTLQTLRVSSDTSVDL